MVPGALSQCEGYVLMDIDCYTAGAAKAPRKARLRAGRRQNPAKRKTTFLFFFFFHTYRLSFFFALALSISAPLHAACCYNCCPPGLTDNLNYLTPPALLKCSRAKGYNASQAAF